MTSSSSLNPAFHDLVPKPSPKLPLKGRLSAERATQRLFCAVARKVKKVSPQALEAAEYVFVWTSASGWNVAPQSIAIAHPRNVKPR